MPAPKIRKQRVAIALEQQKQLEADIEEAKRAKAIELKKQNQKKGEAAMANAKEIEPPQKKTKRTKSNLKKRRTK